MSKPKTKLPPKDHFVRYLRVQCGGKYNMFDPRACAATGLTRAEYGAVMDNYDALTARWPRAVAEVEKEMTNG